MADLVVTVPKDRWTAWVEEGDLPDDGHVVCQSCWWSGHRDAWQLHRPPEPRITEAFGDERSTCLAAYTDEPEWGFRLWGRRPDAEPGDRVYVVAHGRLRGYAPLARIMTTSGRTFELIRRAGAVPVTIDRPIRGFRGWRYRDWERCDEVPFPGWREP